jgi:ribose 5-phosphate isomerase B
MIYLGSDHGGYELKEKVKQWLHDSGYEYKDMGPDHLDPADDFPVYAFAVAEAVADQNDPEEPWDKQSKGILICRSSFGVVIAANKVIGIRAASIFDEKGAKQCRTNDDVNILGLSGDWMTDEQAHAILKTWLATEFTHAERHQRRLDQISAYEIGGEEDGCCGGGGEGCCGNCSRT